MCENPCTKVQTCVLPRTRAFSRAVLKAELILRTGFHTKATIGDRGRVAIPPTVRGYDRHNVTIGDRGRVEIPPAGRGRGGEKEKPAGLGRLPVKKRESFEVRNTVWRLWRQ